jgi:cysteine desulfurase
MELPIDFASFSAHKIHGPKGVGALFIRKGIDFKAHQHGGGQERNRRAGTESPALIVGFQVAARRAVKEMKVRAEVMASRIALLRELLTSTISNIRINTLIEQSLPNILNISFLDAEKLDGESILQSLDIQGIAASNGSACVSGSLQPSHVLSAMGLPAAEARAAVRFSVSKDTPTKSALPRRDS